MAAVPPENGNDSMIEPFIGHEEENEQKHGSEYGDLGMVLLSTSIAVYGSFEFGSCVSIEM